MGSRSMETQRDGFLEPSRSTELDAYGRGYPRPQFRRAEWYSLNGPWEFAPDPQARFRLPDEVTWEQTILVPFAPETEKSGIGIKGFLRTCWYRRRVALPALAKNERFVLHFGAVDYRASVWVDGSLAVKHEGGYTPFHVDVTDLLRPGEVHEIVVRAEDDPADLSKPRGKQDWKLEPHSIWYPRTTGIWQSVWLEKIPSTYLASVRWLSSLDRWEISIDARVGGEPRERLRLAVKLRAGDQLLADDTFTVVAGEVHRRIAFSDPGIDDFRNELLWSPASPTIIDAHLELWGDRGELLDVVESYTALRTLAIQGDRVVLNGRPIQLRLVLDQGYWPESGMTAPDDAAFQKDVELVKAMGFNGVRKHQKIEDPRFHYWADRMGLLVWGEMPSAYRFTQESIHRVTREWMEAVKRDQSHPCIIAWVPFNESWGVPNLPDNPAERHYVQGLYYLTKTMDPSRPVVGNDGWESVATDLIGIHDYDSIPERMARRYHAEDVHLRLFRRERPGGRVLLLDGQNRGADHPIVLSEFGGIAMRPEHGDWGYSHVDTPEELSRRLHALMRVVRNLELLSGFCYTQFTDTYQEANGLLTMDRKPKIPLAAIASAITGDGAPHTPEGQAGMLPGKEREREKEMHALNERGHGPS